MSTEFRTSIKDTLANKDWWGKNLAGVKDLLPLTWTHMQNLNGLQIGYKMKLLGIDWRNQDEFGRVMVFFEKIGLMQRQNVYQIRVNPNWEFHPEAFDSLGN